MFTLKLLGTASLEGPDGPVTGRAAQGRRLALLALLALARGRPVPRDKVIALLWPDSGPDRARPQLSHTLYLVRSGLGQDVVRAAGDDLALDPELIGSDVAAFERLLDEGRPGAAVELYGGPLLDGFHLSGAAEFERWLDAERARLGQRYAAALESLAEAAEAREAHVEAVGWWRRLAAHDPYSGRVALRLMRALEAAGDRAGALRHAQVHAALLREEFEAEPDPAVAAYAERLRREPPPRPAPPPAGARTPPPTAPEGGPAPRAGEEPAGTQLPEVAAAGPGTRDTGGRRRPARTRAWITSVLVALLGASAVYGVRRARLQSPPPAARSVGVLPFVNLSPDPANDYFSDGLTEQIISALSRIGELRVAARTSSFALRDQNLDARAIGEVLGVAAVLEGTVRKNGNRLRITAHLIDAATGYHIWSAEYDRELQGIFAVQDEIARAIANALELRLVRSAATGPPQLPDLEAYDLYLRGLYLRNRMSAVALRQAVDYFDRAIAIERGFAAAHAAKASVIAPMLFYRQIPWDSGVDELRAVTARALELDPALGEAHAALGILRLFFDWDWEGAEQALRRALELNPSDAHAWHHLANYMRAMGRGPEAVSARERSLELDPLNARTHITLGRDLLVAGDPDRAMVHFRRAIELNPVIPIALGLGPSLPVGPAEVHLRQGRPAQAVEEYVRIATLRGATARELDALRRAYADSGLPGFWRAWLDMDLRQSSGNPDPMRIAELWALIGDTAQAFRWLETAYADRNPGLIFIRSEYPFAHLRTHPHFQRIVEGMRFPER
ncbi:MAG TPA: BTAD domain-containing putative transcriptional regulator [Longimicrobiales bacterium]